MRKEDMEYYSEFLKEFQKETDRGCALVGAALLDNQLEDTLRSFFLKCKASEELLSTYGPLGSFSSRIKLAYCIGAIVEPEYHELEIIRNIRNEFAHGLHGISFETQRIKDLCSNFKSDTPGDISNDPRFQFINAVVCTSSGLFYRSELVSFKEIVVKLPRKDDRRKN